MAPSFSKTGKSANPLIPFEPDQQAEILQQHPQIQMQMILDVAPPKQQKDRFLKDDYRWIPESASYRSNHAFPFSILKARRYSKSIRCPEMTLRKARRTTVRVLDKIGFC